MATTTTEQLTGERADLVETLRLHRGFLRQTVAGLSEPDARALLAAAG